MSGLRTLIPSGSERRNGSSGGDVEATRTREVCENRVKFKLLIGEVCFVNGTGISPISYVWRNPQLKKGRKPHMRRVAAFVVLFFVSCTGVLRAQSTSASITGRVTDPSKALIVNAKVAAINAGTNVRYEGGTNDSGEYYLTNLPPGS